MNNLNQKKPVENAVGKAVPSPSEEGLSKGLLWRGEALHIGIIGAGNFASFAAKAFLKIDGIKIIAVSDVNEKNGKLLAEELNAKFYPQYEKLLEDKNVDLIYIATPPFLHYEISKAGLQAGKHVICEKPAALKTSDAQELQSLAKEFNLLYVVNLMQRYNPLYKVVKNIIGQKLIGNFLHGFFENYASDENLNEQHWFWNEEKSGGIFIEHGVHFFDMFSGWLGNGKVINAIQLHRENVNTKMYDRVQATLLYKDGIVNFYHGFDQPKILDRQEMRLQFEKGEITLYEWVPVRMTLHGLFKKEELKKLHELIGPFAIVKHDTNQTNKKVRGKFSEISFADHVTIEYGSNADKQNRYQQMLTDMLNDQWQWIKNKNHLRIIDDNNAVESLQLAEQAAKMAKRF